MGTFPTDRNQRDREVMYKVFERRFGIHCRETQKVEDFPFGFVRDRIATGDSSWYDPEKHEVVFFGPHAREDQIMSDALFQLIAGEGIVKSLPIRLRVDFISFVGKYLNEQEPYLRNLSDISAGSSLLDRVGFSKRDLPHWEIISRAYRDVSGFSYKFEPYRFMNASHNHFRNRFSNSLENNNYNSLAALAHENFERMPQDSSRIEVCRAGKIYTDAGFDSGSNLYMSRKDITKLLSSLSLDYKVSNIAVLLKCLSEPLAFLRKRNRDGSSDILVVCDRPFGRGNYPILFLKDTLENKENRKVLVTGADCGDSIRIAKLFSLVDLRYADFVHMRESRMVKGCFKLCEQLFEDFGFEFYHWDIKNGAEVDRARNLGVLQHLKNIANIGKDFRNAMSFEEKINILSKLVENNGSSDYSVKPSEAREDILGEKVSSRLLSATALSRVEKAGYKTYGELFNAGRTELRERLGGKAYREVLDVLSGCGLNVIDVKGDVLEDPVFDSLGEALGSGASAAAALSFQREVGSLPDTLSGVSIPYPIVLDGSPLSSLDVMILGAACCNGPSHWSDCGVFISGADAKRLGVRITDGSHPVHISSLAGERKGRYYNIMDSDFAKLYPKDYEYIRSQSSKMPLDRYFNYLLPNMKISDKESLVRLFGGEGSSRLLGRKTDNPEIITKLTSVLGVFRNIKPRPGDGSPGQL